MGDAKSQGEKSEMEEPHEELSEKIAIPLGATVENIIKALRILGDSGGKGRFNELAPMFGDKKSEKTLFSFSVNAAAAFGLINPHKGRSPYVISKDGEEFLSSEKDEQRKTILFSRFLSFEGYRKILIGMKNSKDKSMKKQTITNAWMSIAGGKSSTRRNYTTTFASVGNWCGAIKDTGQTCILTQEGETALTQILKGEEIKTKPALETTIHTTTEKPVLQIPLEITQCPVCSKPNLVWSDKYLDKVATKGGTMLVIERTFQCQGCSNKFSRIVKELVPSPD
jgi:hypothetical protein